MNNEFIWQGRIDDEDKARGLRWHQVVNLETNTTTDSHCCLLGLACDLGVKENKGRVGAKTGPNAIRSALTNLPYQHNVSLLDKGDVVANECLDSCQQNYATEVSKALEQDCFVIGLGGGHEIAWGSYLGLQHAFNNSDVAQTNPKRIGIINFDAHFDLRLPAPHASSGTSFRQIYQHCTEHSLPFHYACLGIAKTANTLALFDSAAITGTRFLVDEDCSLDKAIPLLTPMLSEIDLLYVTICLDAFSSADAPGVSAPSTLGIEIPFVLQTLRWLAVNQDKLSYQWALTDVAEMNPTYDIDQRTAKLAARLLFEVVNAKFP